MTPDTRALIAAAAHAFVSGRKVAGLYDHAAARHRRIAAESRGRHLQGYDGDRDRRFGGTLPELSDTEGMAVHLTVQGAMVRAYDRSSDAHLTVQVVDRLVQLFDHAEERWFAYAVQVV